MFEIGTRGDYAVILITDLAQNTNNNPLSLRKIAQIRHLPLPYLAQVATALKKRGLIISKEGRSGGYYLAKKASQIAILDILEAVNGPFAVTKCTHGLKNCPLEEYCSLNHNWQEIKNQMTRILKDYKVSNMINNNQSTT